MIPEKFRYKPIKKTYQQLQIIKSLLKSKNIERVIIATDAGREGEVIARTILLESGFTDKERIFRFWTSQALVPDVVRKTMNQLKPLSHYDRLWRAGYYRQVADWLVGMNCTRMVTLRLHGELFSVGRVQTAVLALIVDRKNERDHFVPEIYWILKVLFSNDKGKWTGYWFKNQKVELESGVKPNNQNSKSIQIFKKKEDMERVFQKVKQLASGVVQSIKKEKKKEPPPFLFSLTDLQQEANRRFGFSAQKTLIIAQSLYQDKKCLSYPRTDSRVLGTQNLEMVQNIINKLSEAYQGVSASGAYQGVAISGGYQGIFQGIDHSRISLSNKRVFNDAKLTDHHALIPFKPISADATPDEKNLFNLVIARFAAAFYPDCEFENTHVVTLLGDETFQTHGRIILVPGWRSVYQEQTPNEQVVEHVPPLVKGDVAIPEKITPEEKQTTPPPDYNDSLILKDMTNPGKYVEEEEIKKLYRGDIGIGTQATRAQIIETLIIRKYIERSGKKLIATEKGVLLINILRKCPITSVLTSPEETARWEMSLNLIALGENSDTSFLTKIKAFVTRSINELKLVIFDVKNSNAESPVSFDVKNSNSESPVSFNVKNSNSESPVSFNVKNSNIELPASAVIGKCPACGQPVRENRKAFSCTNYSCKFLIWKMIAGKIITPDMASNLLTFKKSGSFNGFISREKKQFSASLLLHQQDGEWKVSFNFNNSTLQSEKFKKTSHSSPPLTPSPSALTPPSPPSLTPSPSALTPSPPSLTPSPPSLTPSPPSLTPSPNSSNLSNLYCPLCSGHIIEGKKGYGCSNWKPEHGNCHFVIWKEIMGKTLTQKNIETILKGKTTLYYVFKAKDGNKFKAKLKMIEQRNINSPINVIQNTNKKYLIQIMPEHPDTLLEDHRYILCSR